MQLKNNYFLIFENMLNDKSNIYNSNPNLTMVAIFFSNSIQRNVPFLQKRARMAIAFGKINYACNNDPLLLPVPSTRTCSFCRD